MMRLIDVTNSYAHLVSQQLSHTDTEYVKVYSLGSTTVVYTRAAKHDEVLFTNDTRNVKDREIQFVLQKLCGVDIHDVTIIRGERMAEISLNSTQRQAAAD